VNGSAWPLWDLVVRTPRLEMRLPREHELVELLELARQGIHEPHEMPFGFAWTDFEPPYFERNFLQYHWSTRATWGRELWTLDFAVWADGQLVGTQGLRGEKFYVMKTVGTGSWLGRAYQGQGIGKEMRSAALSFAFDYLGADWATTSAFVDNASSAGVSRALGYVEDGHERLAPRGEARDLQRYLMTRDNWYSRDRPPIEVWNFDACREMFAIE
jgi:RimJ/RimL family protein N-acetyltransferase